MTRRNTGLSSRNSVKYYSTQLEVMSTNKQEWEALHYLADLLKKLGSAEKVEEFIRKEGEKAD